MVATIGMNRRATAEFDPAKFTPVRAANLRVHMSAREVGAAPPETQRLFAALQRNQADTDRFMGVIAGTTPVPEFFAPENVRRMMTAAGPL